MKLKNKLKWLSYQTPSKSLTILNWQTFSIKNFHEAEETNIKNWQSDIILLIFVRQYPDHGIKKKKKHNAICIGSFYYC